MEPARFRLYTVLGSVPFTLALIYAGTVLRSNRAAGSSTLAYFNCPLIARVVLGVVFIALQIAGILAPGWPPRRAQNGLQ